MAENVADIKRIKFDEVLELPVMQFLMFADYNIFKNKEFEKRYKK